MMTMEIQNTLHIRDLIAKLRYVIIIRYYVIQILVSVLYHIKLHIELCILNDFVRTKLFHTIYKVYTTFHESSMD